METAWVGVDCTDVVQNMAVNIIMGLLLQKTENLTN